MAFQSPANPLAFPERERLSDLEEGSAAGICRLDPHGRVLRANAAWFALCAMEPTQALGDGWFACVHPGDLPRVRAEWESACSHGTACDLVYRLERSGSTMTVRSSLRPSFDAELLAGFTATTVDITELATMGAALARSREEFRVLAEAMPQLVWAAGPDGEIDYFNERWLAYTGLTLEQTNAAGSKGVVHPSDVDMTWARWNEALAKGTPYEIEYRLRSASDGTYRWFLGRALPIADEQGTIARWIGTATEIDAQKRTNDNLRFVLESSAMLNALSEVPAICDTLGKIAIERVADWCVVSLAEADGTYTTASIAHKDSGLLEDVEELRARYPVRKGDSIDTCTRRNVPLLVPVITEEEVRRSAQDEAHAQLMLRLELRSAMIVPLSLPFGGAAGAITLISSTSRRIFDESDLEVAQLVARGAAAAIHNARTLSKEREVAERLRFSLRTSELVFDGLDVYAIFDRVTAFLVGDVADFASILLIEDGDALRIVSTAHRDPTKAVFAERMEGERAMRPEAEAEAIRLLSAHQPLHDRFFPKHFGEGIVWEYLLPEIRALGMQSTVTIPLHARGETYGALLLGRAKRGRLWTDEEMADFADLGRRLSMAIDHARTLERERRISTSLQRALLPTPGQLPKDAMLHFSAEYRPNANESGVGGDWYDALTLNDGSVVVSVGDVMGRGLAAAGLMGKLRQALGVVPLYERDPARILDAVDFLLRTRGSSAIATAFLAIIDPQRKSLRYASAGHPPALMRRRGEVVTLAGSGLPLGLRDAFVEPSQEVPLTGAEMLLFYTDGLTEATHDLAYGERRLHQVVASEAILYVRNAAKFACDACLPIGAQDDTAVLAVSFGGRRHWSFDAENAQAAHDAREEFVAYLRGEAVAEADFAAAEIVFGELIGNVVRHAPGPIEVQVDWSGDSPVLHVTDRGRGFVRHPGLPANPLSESGRGLYIIDQFTRNLRVERIAGYGNHVAVELTIDRKQQTSAE